MYFLIGILFILKKYIKNDFKSKRLSLIVYCFVLTIIKHSKFVLGMAKNRTNCENISRFHKVIMNSCLTKKKTERRHYVDEVKKGL